MSNQEIANKCFTALPNIKECWVTADGHYHLHSANGGEHITRLADEEKVLVNPKKKK